MAPQFWGEWHLTVTLSRTIIERLQRVLVSIILIHLSTECFGAISRCCKISRCQCYKTFYGGIFRDSMLILTFCVIKLCFLGNYHGMAVNYNAKGFITLARGGKLKYNGNLLQNFSPTKWRYCGKLPRYLYNIGPRVQNALKGEFHKKIVLSILFLSALFWRPLL